MFYIYQGAGKRPGSKKTTESPEIRSSLPVPIYVFHDSEQKVNLRRGLKLYETFIIKNAAVITAAVTTAQITR